MDLRAMLQRLGGQASPAQPEPEPVDELDSQDPAEPEPVTTGAAPPVRGGARLPDWRLPKRDLADEEPPVLEKADDTEAAPGDDHDDEDQADDDSEDQADPDDADDEDEAEDEDGEPGESPKGQANGRRWGLHGSGKRVHRRPAYQRNGSPRASLLEAWAAMRPATRHGLYNGTALALGFWAGVPQFFTAETAHLAATYHSWTAFYVCVWYGIAVFIWLFDYSSRNWLPPFALLARVPLASMVIGVALYGNPV